MSDGGDYRNEMIHRIGNDLDRDTERRLLDGAVGPEDAPQGYAALAGLLSAAAAPGRPAEVNGDLLSAMSEAIVSTPQPDTTAEPRRRKMIPQFLASKVAAAVLVGGVALTGGTAAAATGSLPDAAQDFVAAAAEKVGFDLPASDRSERGRSTADDAKTRAEDNADKGAEVSDTARNTESTGVDKGAEISTTASDGRSRAGTGGAPESTPAPATSGSGAATTPAPAEAAPVETPNSGGTGTAGGASGGGADAGTGTADDYSDGRSSGGTGNAEGAPRP